MSATTVELEALVQGVLVESGPRQTVFSELLSGYVPWRDLEASRYWQAEKLRAFERDIDVEVEWFIRVTGRDPTVLLAHPETHAELAAAVAGVNPPAINRPWWSRLHVLEDPRVPRGSWRPLDERSLKSLFSL